MKYDLFAIGNALVDTEIEVSADFLSDLGIAKGLMTLIDESRHNQIAKAIAGSSHQRSCGGSAANTTIAAAQLGAKTYYNCKVAADESGEFYLTDLLKNGVDTNLVTSTTKEQTGKCFVFITPDADRSMLSYLGVTETLSVQELNRDLLKQSRCLYMEGYLVTSATGRAAAIEARQIAEMQKIKTALTFSDPGVLSHFKAGFHEMLGSRGVDLLFCNESEAKAFSGSSEFLAVSDPLLTVASTVCVTRGPKGAVVFQKGQDPIEVEAPQVKAIDTNGAGDAFAGGFLYSFLQSQADLRSAALLGVQVASELVTEFGARLSPERIQKVKMNWTSKNPI